MVNAMKYLFLLSLAAALCACATLETSAPHATISKIESRELPSEQVEDIVLGQLSNVMIFEQPRSRPGRPPRLALEDLWFRTVAHATGHQGLCTAQTVIVTFHPAEHDRGADTQVRAVGLETIKLYRFLEPPTYPERFTDDYGEDDDCARLSATDNGFFEADDASTAYNGTLLFTLLQQELTSLSTSIELTCNTSRTPCQRQLEEALGSPIERIARCNERTPNFCYVIEAGGSLVFLGARHSAERGRPMQWHIETAHVAELIILEHERAD